MNPWYLMPIVVVHAAVGLAFVPWLFSWSGLFIGLQPVWLLVIYVAHLAVFGLAGFACGLAMGCGIAEWVRLSASWILWGGLIRTVTSGT